MLAGLRKRAWDMPFTPHLPVLAGGLSGCPAMLAWLGLRTLPGLDIRG